RIALARRIAGRRLRWRPALPVRARGIGRTPALRGIGHTRILARRRVVGIGTRRRRAVRIRARITRRRWRRAVRIRLWIARWRRRWACRAAVRVDRAAALRVGAGIALAVVTAGPAARAAAGPAALVTAEAAAIERLLGLTHGKRERGKAGAEHGLHAVRCQQL